MKRQRNTTQMKEKNWKHWNPNKWRGNRQTTWKIIQNHDSKDDQNLENTMEKMQESINKDLEELKNKRTETNNTITEIKKYSRRNQ